MTRSAVRRAALWAWAASLAAVAVSCRPSAPAPEERHGLLLYCGAGVRPAAEALIRAFEASHSARISAVYAGSGQLLAQLGASKQGDLFMPGEDFYVNQALSNGWTDAGSRRDVALFVPVILVAKGNPLGIRTLEDMVDKPVRLGMGDERAVAVGRRALELFAKNGIDGERMRARVVMRGGTVSELGTAVEMGSIDAAIVWDATARQFRRAADAVAIPAERNIASPVPIARTRFTAHPGLCDEFIRFAVSAEGRAIFREQGYTVQPPAEGAAGEAGGGK